MKFTIVILAALALCTFGCGYGSNYNSGMRGGTMPTMTQLVPGSVAAGAPSFMLTVNGTGFTNSAIVYWAGMPQQTQFVTTNQLVATIPADQVSAPTTVQVYVRSNNQNSNTMSFTVN